MGGFTAIDFLESGHTLEQLLKTENPAGTALLSQLLEAGFTVIDFLESGHTLEQLRKLSLSARQLKGVQKWPLELRRSGYTAKQLKEAGYPLANMKEVFNLAELKDCGYTAWVLCQSGFGIKELLTAGFTEKELVDAGFIIAGPTQKIRTALPSKA